MFGIFLLVVVYNKILPVIWECIHSAYGNIQKETEAKKENVMSL
jgi:hypothetical protein